MKIVKYVAFGLGGVVALLVALFIVVAIAFDSNRLKAELAQTMTEKKQRTLRIDGDVTLSFWPSIGVRISKTTLSERNSDTMFLELDSGHLSLALLPLLTQEIVIDRLTLDGLNASVVRFKDGRYNFDDLLEKEKDDQKAVRFAVAGVQLAAARISFRDDGSGQTSVLSDLSLATGSLGAAGAGPLDFASRIVVDKPATAVDVKLTGKYRYDIDQKSFNASALKFEASGELAGTTGLTLAVSASSAALGAGAFEIDRLDAGIKARHGQDDVSARITLPKLMWAADTASGSVAAAALKIVGPRRDIQARVNMANLEGGSGAFKAAKVRFDLDAKQGELLVKGAAASPLTGRLTDHRIDLPKLEGAVSVSHPRMQGRSVTLPITGNLRADFAKPAVSSELSTRFDESNVFAKLAVDRFTPFTLSLDADIDRLNADTYISAKPTDPVQAGDAGDKPMDFSALKGLNLNATVKVGALQISNVKASNVRLAMRAANGRLDVSPLAANLYHGSLKGGLSLDANNNQFTTRQNLADVAINPLMKDALKRDVIEGRGSLALDVVTSGATVSEMKKALAGHARILLRDGALKGINLTKVFREAKGLINRKQDYVSMANQMEKTDFDELTASFRIARGVAHSDDLVAKSPFLRLTGGGDINVGQGTMNFMVKAAAVGAWGGQQGRDWADLKGVTVPVRVSGPFDQLSYRLEFGSLVGGIAKAKAEEALREAAPAQIRKSGQDKLLDGVLKGLLK